MQLCVKDLVEIAVLKQTKETKSKKIKLVKSLSVFRHGDR